MFKKKFEDSNSTQYIVYSTKLFCQFQPNIYE